MPDTGLAEALAICERVRHAVESYAWHALHPELQVTISIGVVMRLPGEGAEEALERADRALYEAKRHGRNCVEAGVAP